MFFLRGVVHPKLDFPGGFNGPAIRRDEYASVEGKTFPVIFRKNDRDFCAGKGKLYVAPTGELMADMKLSGVSEINTLGLKYLSLDMEATYANKQIEKMRITAIRLSSETPWLSCTLSQKLPL